MPRWGPHPEAVERTSEEARAGRSDLERRLLADPAASVAATERAFAGDLDEAERFFRGGFELAYRAYNRRDWELNTLFLDADDYVFRPAAGHELIDAREQYLGVPGYFEAQDLLLDVWSDVTIELSGVVMRPPDGVITLMTWRGLAARGAVEMEWGCVSDNRFRGGLNTSQTFWWDRQRAERDLGFALPSLSR